MTGKIAIDSLTLDRASRHRRRAVLTTDRGHDVLLDLPEATRLAEGDGLRLENGAHVRIIAAPEPLLQIHAVDGRDLARIAWHIGNRHVACEVTADALFVEPDHVLEAMVVGLGARVHHVIRPFEPEGGAYDHDSAPSDRDHRSTTHAHGHAHGHAQAHSHAHAHSHASHARHPTRP
jgi:urease accessory protein